MPPGLRIVIALAPVRLQVLIVKVGQVAVDPGREVHAVGDRRDRHFPHRQAGPQLFPHALRNFAVQAADRIAKGRSLHSADGHREGFVGLSARGTPQREERIQRDSRLQAVGSKMLPHHAQVETVESGGYRGVGGEDVVGARGMPGFIEGETVIRHQNANSLDGQERGMPFVHVINGGVEAQRLVPRGSGFFAEPPRRPEIFTGVVFGMEVAMCGMPFHRIEGGDGDQAAGTPRGADEGAGSTRCR